MNATSLKKPRLSKRTADHPQAAPRATHGPAHDVGTTLGHLRQTAVQDLVRIAQAEGIASPADLSRRRLVTEQNRKQGQQDEAIRAEGTLEVLAEGFGFLRRAECNYLNSPDDVYVSPAQIRLLGLRTGMTVRGTVRPPRPGHRAFALMQVETVDGVDPIRVGERVPFEERTPLHPDRRLVLGGEAGEIELRVIDLVTPIGKGQRGLIVAPPRTGKTVLLQKLARGILRDHPECHLIVLLIDERPEEVTEMRRNVVCPSAEVVSSTFDKPASDHIHAAELVLEKAKRLVEAGRDVVVLLDSITRLARAYNAEAPDHGKTLSGGLTAGALEKPKRFFGAARNFEEGGSLTILATALIDTGSRMDEVLFEEFKGTGNMELHLDRRLADRRVWPAINISASGTRREELLFDPEELHRVWLLRKVLSGRNPVEAMELLTGRLQKSRSNAEFLMGLPPS
jgi:transcription termination factor Rho